MLFFLLATNLFAQAPADQTVEFFKPTGAITTFQIQVTPENLALLTKDPRKAVRCTMKVGDQTFQQVGIHLKGQAGSFRDWNDKPALTLNMDKFIKKQTFKGMDKFHLNNSVQDESFMNEIITGEMFREAGVPTARGTHALVELNGRKMGLYLLKEGYDKEFLKHYFTNTRGNLYDGGFLTDIDQDLELKSGMENQRKDLKDLAAAARIEDHKARLATLDKKVDLEKLYALWAIEVLCGDWDGYARNRNNFKVYFDPKSGKAVFFAHGKDQMFQNPQDGIFHEWGGLVCRRLFETEEGKKRYGETLKQTYAKQFDMQKIEKTIDDYTARIRTKLNIESPGKGDEWIKQIPNYKNTLKARHEYLKTELAKIK